MLSSLPRSRRRDADDDGRAEIAPTPFSACLIKRKGGSSVDEQKEVLPPSVMRCFDRTKPRGSKAPFPRPGKGVVRRQHVLRQPNCQEFQDAKKARLGAGPSE
jgi:hypothetical protein